VGRLLNPVRVTRPPTRENAGATRCELGERPVEEQGGEKTSRHDCYKMSEFLDRRRQSGFYPTVYLREAGRGGTGRRRSARPEIRSTSRDVAPRKRKARGEKKSNNPPGGRLAPARKRETKRCPGRA